MDSIRVDEVDTVHIAKKAKVMTSLEFGGPIQPFLPFLTTPSLEQVSFVPWNFAGERSQENETHKIKDDASTPEESKVKLQAEALTFSKKKVDFYDRLISKAAKKKNYKKVASLFSKMMQAKAITTRKTYDDVLDAYFARNDMFSIKKLLTSTCSSPTNEVPSTNEKEEGEISDVEIDLQTQKIISSQTPKSSIPVYICNSMIKRCNRMGKHDLVREIFDTMLQSPHKPDAYTYNRVLYNHMGRSNFGEVSPLLELMDKEKVTPDKTLCCTLLCNSNGKREAIQVLKFWKEKGYKFTKEVFDYLDKTLSKKPFGGTNELKVLHSFETID